MKRLMVKRCEATRPVDEGLYHIVHGLDHSHLRSPDISRVREVIRCEEPLGHSEAGHHGSEDDAGRHRFSWGGWGQP